MISSTGAGVMHGHVRRSASRILHGLYGHRAARRARRAAGPGSCSASRLIGRSCASMRRRRALRTKRSRRERGLQLGAVRSCSGVRQFRTRPGARLAAFRAGLLLGAAGASSWAVYAASSSMPCVLFERARLRLDRRAHQLRMREEARTSSADAGGLASARSAARRAALRAWWPARP